MTDDTSTRAAALKLLAKGQITISEAARLAGASRQLVMYWVKSAGIDPGAARAAHIARLWEKETG